MSGRNRSAKSNHGHFNAEHARQAKGRNEPTTESLAAAMEAELANVESQLAAISRFNGEARPYEAFEFPASRSPADTSTLSFEYDGHCPPVAGRPRTAIAGAATAFTPSMGATDASKEGDNHDLVLANRVRATETAPNGPTAVAAEMEAAFQQLARLFSGDAAQQWQSATRQLDEARDLMNELRDILAGARKTLADIQRLRDDVPRTRAACNPACRKS